MFSTCPTKFSDCNAVFIRIPFGYFKVWPLRHRGRCFGRFIPKASYAMVQRTNLVKVPQSSVTTTSTSS